MKRFVDVIIASFALTLLAPVMAAIALAIKLSDGGPVLFHQQRVGRYGELFWIHKFRTMVVGAERLGIPLTAGNDSRVTRVGCWLRRRKLDELPQLWNVVRGEMSLVGPRPEVARYVEQYDEQQRRVLELKPGITDPASIAFIDEESLLARAANAERCYLTIIMPQKNAINLQYAEHASCWTDCGIILKTIVKLLSRKNIARGAGSVLSSRSI